MTSNSTIRVIIVDDEKPARDAIKVYLEKYESFLVVDECEDGHKALNSIRKHLPDLVFLDIEMPELNGMELIRSLKSPTPKIVFITAYHHYAVEAFEENAADYLLKPFDGGRFDKMIAKVTESMIKDNQDSLRALTDGLKQLEELHKEKHLRKIPVKRKGKIILIPVREIMWIESSGSFTKLHRDDSIEISNFSISQLEVELDPAQYVRIHKSHIVNLEYIKTIESYFHGEYIVTMMDGTDLKLSRGYKDRLDLITKQYK